MGVTYAELDHYMKGGSLSEDKEARIQQLHDRSEHKRIGIRKYSDEDSMWSLA